MTIYHSNNGSSSNSWTIFTKDRKPRKVDVLTPTQPGSNSIPKNKKIRKRSSGKSKRNYQFSKLETVFAKFLNAIVKIVSVVTKETFNVTRIVVAGMVIVCVSFSIGRVSQLNFNFKDVHLSASFNSSSANSNPSLTEKSILPDINLKSKVNKFIDSPTAIDSSVASYTGSFNLKHKFYDINLNDNSPSPADSLPGNKKFKPEIFAFGVIPTIGKP